MKYKYSLTLDAFYPVDMLNAYTDLPADLIDVSEQVYETVLHARAQGLAYRIADDGASAIVAPSSTHDWDTKAGKWVLNTEKQADFDAQAQKQAEQQAVEAVKHALQAHIDAVAIGLGFSGGNSVMLYAGFANAFQSLAKAFGAWEADIWVLANEQMSLVKAGKKAMPSLTEAVGMIPAFVPPSAN